MTIDPALIFAKTSSRPDLISEDEAANMVADGTRRKEGFMAEEQAGERERFEEAISFLDNYPSAVSVWTESHRKYVAKILVAYRQAAKADAPTCSKETIESAFSYKWGLDSMTPHDGRDLCLRYFRWGFEEAQGAAKADAGREYELAMCDSCGGTEGVSHAYDCPEAQD